MVQTSCSIRKANLKAFAHDNVSTSISKDEDSAAALSSLCWCSLTLTVKQHFQMFSGNLLFFSLCPLPSVLSLGIAEKSLAQSSLHSLYRYLNAFLRFPSFLVVMSRLYIWSDLEASLC